MSKIKVKYHVFKIECTYHGDKEYILESGNFKRHGIKITNTKWFQSETFDFWGHKIVSQKGALKAFQKLMFHGIAAAVGPDHFCFALKLDEDIMATEIRFMEYKETCRKFKNIFSPKMLNEFQMSGYAMALIAKMRTDGINCGLNLKGK